jgi:hypothetical protein
VAQRLANLQARLAGVGVWLGIASARPDVHRPNLAKADGSTCGTILFAVALGALVELALMARQGDVRERIKMPLDSFTLHHLRVRYSTLPPYTRVER